MIRPPPNHGWHVLRHRHRAQHRQCGGRSFDHALLPLNHDLQERRSSAEWQPRCALAGPQRQRKRHCDRYGECGHGRWNLFLLACTDDGLVVPEMNANNNCKASAAQVTVSGPDLIETAVSDPPTTLATGGTFSVTDTVHNTGSAAAAASTTRYYLSTTTSKSGARQLNGSRAVPSLAPSASASGTVTVTVSAGTAGGTYFLLAYADDTLVVPEIKREQQLQSLGRASHSERSGPHRNRSK